MRLEAPDRPPHQGRAALSDGSSRGAASRRTAGDRTVRTWRAIPQVFVVAGELKEADAHLVGRLLAPVHFDRRLARVAGVLGGVVEVGDHLDPRPLGQGDGRRELVRVLPVEVPVVDADQGLPRAVGADGRRGRKSLPSQCMCGNDRQQVRVLAGRSRLPFTS